MAVQRFRLADVSRERVAAGNPLLGDAARRAIFVTGPAVERILRLADAGAMTLGRHVLVRRALLASAGGARHLPGWLVAHELAHVAQYARAGALPFLARYVAGYVRALRTAHRETGTRALGAAARYAAYRGIPAEQEARSAEAGFEAGIPLALDPL